MVMVCEAVACCDGMCSVVMVIRVGSVWTVVPPPLC